jgi:type I restriction-modification system DNA methylase subunit
MDKSTAQRTVSQTFKAAFDRDRFRNFVNELTNGFDETKKQTMQIPDAFKPHVASCLRIGTYESPEFELADVLIVHLTESYKLERTRTALRDFVAHKLKRGDGEENAYKEAALVAFVAPDAKSWRFSFVRMEYETMRDPKTGRIKPEERLTPARRYSYLVGAEEECHTAQARFLDLLKDTTSSPTLAKIEEAFSVESVTKEFFDKYAGLFQRTHTALEAIIAKDKVVKADFQAKGVCTVDFAKKLLGQIVFLYFIQKKGWLGVPKGGKWGDGPKNFMRQLAARSIADGKCLFNEVLEPLFYDTLATDRGHEAWCIPFACRIPFLNGGLFEPISGYAWQSTNLAFSNDLFTNTETTKEGDTGTGILDVFDRYNFTVNEAEPLEKEVAIDPEMLGKVFENLIEENRRKGLGAYYTPREIVHYMCQESLINYLDTTLNPESSEVPRADIETFIREGDQAAHYETARKGGTVSYARKLSRSIEAHARALDEALKSITVCDPAIGSGAFPVGMMTEIVKARTALTPYFNDIAERTPYHFKRHAIQNSIYGVDIDAGAVEIAKLRLWLSLVVDEEDVTQIKPLPNLDYKVVVGNSLLGVEKDLFNFDTFNNLERLKPQFFDASDQAEKAKLKKQIDSFINTLTNGSLAFDFEIFFSEVFHTRKGFDVVIANPPYGADIDMMLPSLRPLYSDSIRNYAEIYKMFMQLGMRKVRVGGIQTLITPNTFLAQPRYKDIRSVLLKSEIVKIVNLGEEVFENVIVPACLSFIIRSGPSSTYEFADLSKNSKFSGDLNHVAFYQIPLDRVITTRDLSLYFGRELKGNEVLFAEALEIKDAGIQYHRSGIGLKNKGGNDLYERLFNSDRRAFKTSKPVWYGRLMDRWLIAPITDEYFNLNYKDVLKANESASFSQSSFEVNPKIIWRQTASCLRATLDTEGRWFRNTIQCAFVKDAYKRKLDIYYVLGVINSRFITHSYNSLVQEGGRVFPQVKLTHVKKLPLVIASDKQQRQIAELVKIILEMKTRNTSADTSGLERDIDQLVYALYGLTPEEIQIVEASAK